MLVILVFISSVSPIIISFFSKESSIPLCGSGMSPFSVSGFLIPKATLNTSLNLTAAASDINPTSAPTAATPKRLKFRS